MSLPHLLLLGAGHAHVEVLRNLARQPLGAHRVTLLSPEARAPYSGMLPGVIAGAYTPQEASIDIARLAARAGVRFMQEAALTIDPTRRIVVSTSGEQGYDWLSIDIGATSVAPPGAVSVKPISGLLARLPSLAEARQVAVIGAGPAGLELALALRAANGVRRLVLVAGHDGLLPRLPPGARRRAAAALARHDIALTEGHPACYVAEGAVHFPARPPIAADAVLWCAAVSAPPMLAASGLPCDAAGFLHVNAGLDVPSQERIFAAGDAAHFLPAPLPKSGVHAVRQGPVLAANLRRAVAGLPPLPYLPQRRALVLLDTGDGRAIATRGGVTLEGRWAWQWKRMIDRAFIRRYASF